MAESKSIDIDALLALDLTDPASALAFRRGVAELAGWRIKHDRDGYYYLLRPDGSKSSPLIGEKSAVDKFPVFESSVDAALTLPLEEGASWGLNTYEYGTYAAIWKDRSYMDDEQII